MSERKQIAAAFVKAKKEFGPALKCAINPHLRNKYADLSACLEAVDDALLNNGIALMQEVSESEKGVVVETVFVHESGEELRGGRLFVPAAKQDPQAYGSALTYARRYSLMAACGIAGEDDDANAASKATQQRQHQTKPLQHYLDAILAADSKESLKAAVDAAGSAYPTEAPAIQAAIDKLKLSKKGE